MARNISSKLDSLLSVVGELSHVARECGTFSGLDLLTLCHLRYYSEEITKIKI